MQVGCVASSRARTVRQRPVPGAEVEVSGAEVEADIRLVGELPSDRCQAVVATERGEKHHGRPLSLAPIFELTPRDCYEFVLEFSSSPHFALRTRAVCAGEQAILRSTA